MLPKIDCLVGHSLGQVKKINTEETSTKLNIVLLINTNFGGKFIWKVIKINYPRIFFHKNIYNINLILKCFCT